jgi:hypothetical protein
VQRKNERPNTLSQRAHRAGFAMKLKANKALAKRTRNQNRNEVEPDVLIFIDANQYLNLYRIAQGRKLLDALSEQQGYIFVTKQICDEVQRRKMGVAIDFLQTQLAAITVRKFELPDHLFGQSTPVRDDLIRRVKEVNRAASALNKDLRRAAINALRPISRSEDDVSTSLSALFDKAVPHTQRELKRARERKELGNPPGKQSDPLGDQLNWEQLLSRCRSISKLWIVTNDPDYWNRHGDDLFLNSLLYRDIEEANNTAPEIFVFKDALEGLEHFALTTGVKAEKLPTPAEAKQIREEIAGLPPIDFLSASMNIAADAAVQKAYHQQRQRAALIAATAADSLNNWLDGVEIELK